MPPSSRSRATTSSPSRLRAAAVAVALGLVALAGCRPATDGAASRDEGPSTPPTTASGGTTLDVTATTAPPSSGTTRPTFSPQAIAWNRCTPAGYECGTLDVPVDYERPDGATITLALKRRPAEQPGDRIGSLFYNPGGPGGSGIDGLPSAVDRLDAAVLERFDIVSWDPRGVGGSAPLGCDGGVLDLYRTDLDEVHPPPEVDQAAKRVAEQCQASAGDLLPFVGTLDVARDLDTLRSAVGDEKLTYLGVSYGTLIGLVYAELFPANIRAMIIDGVLDPTIDPYTLNLDQSKAVEKAFGQFFDWCRSSSSCPIRSDPAGALDRVQRQAEAGTLQGLIKGQTITLSPSLTTIAVTLATYDESMWPAMARGVQRALDGDATLLASFADAYVSEAELGANNAVNCLDSPTPTDEKLDELAAKAAEQAPRAGLFNANAGRVCEYWPTPPKPIPTTIDASGAPSIQVWGTTGDNATPYTQAVHVAQLLPDARLVTLEANRHAAFGANACVGDLQSAYLIDLEQPADGTKC